MIEGIVSKLCCPGFGALLEYSVCKITLGLANIIATLSGLSFNCSRNSEIWRNTVHYFLCMPKADYYHAGSEPFKSLLQNTIYVQI